VWRSLAFDPKGRYVFAVGAPQRAAWLFPLDGSPIRKLDCPVGDSELSAAAVSPSGRHVATAYWYSVAKGSPRLCTWDVETGEQRHHDLPQGEQSGERRRRTEFDWGVTQMAFVDEDTLLTGGDGGLRRWNLTTGSHELVASSAPGYQLQASFSADRRFALTTERRLAQFADCREARLHDLARATSRSVTEFGACGTWRGQARLDASGAIAVVGSGDGTVRVGKLDSKPHLLLGHRGVVNSVAMSPDLGWAATAGEDSTLRLWPLPDLAKAPLHALPHRELTAKLRSLTNIRVVEDAAAGEGVRLELGPFPGWRTLPEW
jgi:WD40 repeat protein